MAVQESKPLKKITEEADLEEITTTEEDKEELKRFEGSIVDAVLQAANFAQDKEETYTVNIHRNGIIMFSFKIRPLSEEEYNKCREKNTKYVRNKRVGVKVPETTNAVRYRSQLIYTATVAEDRAQIWDQKAVWEKLNVASGIDAIDKILKSGEKDKICEAIDKISGYDTDALEETIKN